MQDGLQLPNTPFEQQLNQSDWGKFLPGTGVLNPQGPSPKTSTQTNYDQLEQSLMAQGAAVNKSAQQIQSPYKETQINPLQLDLTGRYTKQLPGADNEDLWGQSQSNWDKMFNGVAKGLTLAGTTFLQGTAGLLYGVGQVITGHGLNSLYNNDLSNALNDVNNNLENQLPNYYTARERAADWWEPANIFTANFIWDKLVKNLGFSVGAIYSGGVMTKMLRLIPEAFALSKAGILAKTADTMESTLTALPNLQRAGAAENLVLSASKTVNTLNAAISPTERFVISTLGAATEGGIEALQGVNEWRSQKIKEYTDLNGVAPQGEILEKINDMATSLGNARFGMNMALLTATNYIQLPKILSSSYKDSKIIANGVERSINPIARNLETGLYETAKRGTVAKLISKSANIAGLLFSPTESFEEYSQYAAQKAVEDYYNKAYRGEGRDWVDSIAQGYRKASTDKEGLESAFLGGVSGGLQQAGFISGKGIFKSGELGERGWTGTGGERKVATESFISQLNRSKQSLKADEWLQAMAKSAARGINLQLEGQAYIRQGDILETKDNEFDYQHNYLSPRIQYGRMDLVRDNINSYRQLAASTEGWNKLKEMGIANQLDTRQSFLARLAGLEKHAENVNSLHQSLNVRYGGIVNKDNKPKYSEESLEKMIYAASKVANYDERIPQVNTNLSLAGISIAPVIDNIVLNNRVPETATKDALNQINNLDVVSDVKDQLKSDLRDVMEMSLRRKKFLKEYDQLKDNPEKFTVEQEPEIPTTATIGGKERQIGKTYSLTQPLLREENKLSVSPTLEILSSTLGGELEVRTPTGEITYKKPKDVNYDLTEAPVTTQEYSDLVNKSIDKILPKEEGRNTLDQKLSYINAQNDKDLTDSVEAQIVQDTKEFLDKQKKAQAENEKLKKNAALQKKLDEDQKKLNTVVETKDNPTEAEQAASEIQPKAPLPAFLSKEADFYDQANPKPHQKRRLKFLSSLPTFTQKKAAAINVLAISRSNEAKYGLTGLIDWVVGDIQNSRMDEEQRNEYLDEKGQLRPEHEPIVKLYTIKTKDGIRPISSDGTVLETNGFQIVVDDGVFGVFHSTVEGTYKFGPRQGQTNWSGDYTEEEFKALQQQYKDWRERILTSEDSPIYPLKYVSRGVVLRDEENKPVTQTSLVTEEDLLTKEKLITIPTIEGYTIGDTSYKFTPGIPLLTNGANVDFLNNRQFSEKEAEDIFALIRARVEQSASPLAERIEAFLSSILYLRSPRTAEEGIFNSQIFHQSNGIYRQYFFGNQLVVDFNVFALDQKKDQIIDYLKNYFVKTNNQILTKSSSTGFEEAFIKTDGTIDFRQHPSYQYFMLSQKANNIPFLQTRARRSVSPEDPSIIHRYTTLQGSEFDFVAKPKPAATKETAQPAASKAPVTGQPKKRSPFGKPGKTATEQKQSEETPPLQELGQKQPTKRSPFGGSRAEKDKFKGKDPSVDKGEFSYQNETESYTPIDMDKELADIQEKSPFNTEILKNLISLPQGIFAWGQFKGMLISLYENAKAGTGYHELFEGVWKVFTTPLQKADIIQEFRAREGNFSSFDGKEYSNIPFSQASEWQAKEALANEFADYMLSREEPKGVGKIAKWFKQLWELIKSIFNGRISTIDTLFKRIDAGAYKSASPLYTDEETEYSFVDLPYTDQYSTIRGMALEAVRQAINPNNEGAISLTEWEESEISLKGIYDRVFSRLKEIFEEDIYTDKLGYSDEQIAAYEGYWATLQDNWTQVKDATNEYLRSFSIIEGVENENGELSRFDREDYSNRDYIDDDKYWMNDARNTASRSIKLLFATLPESIFQGATLISKRDNTTLMEEQVNYAKTFNSLLAQLVPLNTYDEKMAKLEELSQKFPNFKRLYLRLTTPSNTTNPDSVLNDWKLKTRFYQTMAKQQPTPWIQYNNSDGTSHTQTANLESSKKLIVQSWIDGMKAIASGGKSDVFNINDRGELVIRTAPLRYDIARPEDKFKFLQQLGIPFTREMYDTLSKQEIKDFNDGVVGLSYQLKKANVYILDTAKSLDAIRNLESIASASIASGNDFETTFYNIENERQTTTISTNAISRWVNSLNNSDNRAELLKQMPQLAAITDSIYLNSLLYNQNGEKTSFNIDMGYIQGTIDAKSKPIPGAKLPIFSRLVQEINQNINQRYYVLMPADGKTQWLASLKNTISYQNVSTNSQNYKERIKGLFTGYYETEKAEYERLRETLSEKELDSRQGVFKALSDNYTMSSEDFYTTIGEFFNQQIAEQRRELERYLAIAPSRKGKELYEWKGLDGDFAKANSLNPKALQSQTITDILTFRTLNFAINNVEMHKLFFGSALAYKDAKRWKLFMSPREISMYDSKEYNDFLNEHFNKSVPNSLTGKWTFSDNISTAMMNDLTVVNEALSKFSPKYKEINPTDAQAWSTIVASRERRLKGGSWQAKDEEEFQYSQAQDRQLMLIDRVIQTSNSKADDYYPPALVAKDKELVKKGNPNASYIYVEKPILSGHVQIDGEWSPIADKYSIVSFSYAAVRDTNFRPHYTKMLKQGIGYIIASSGRKIGKTQPNNFYTADGSVDTEPYVGITPVPFSAFGVQTDTSNKKETQTRGSQITKLIIINLHDNGKPITEQAGKLSQDNIALLKEQTKLGYDKLLRAIGAEDKDGQFRITDKRKIVNLLKNELLRREVADNIKALIDVKKDNPDELVMPFEALPNYTQIKNILYSFVDKYILRPKVSGAPKVQVSGALMEKYGVQKATVNNKDVYYSSSLHFYTKEEPWIDVILPAWAADKLRKAGLKWNSTDELYDLFKNSPDAKQLLSGVGFRIPTQELNSVENIRIAGFLPEEFGDTIVVPEEITTKAGSDFDIDKLNSYLQNVYIDNKKNLRVVPYFGIGEEARQKLKKWFNEDVFEDFLLNERELRPEDFESYDEYAARDASNAKDSTEAAMSLVSVEDLRTSEEKALDLFEKYYAQSIENEYYRNMGEILSLPENFERLITPNTTDTLKNIRDQLVELSDVFNSALNPTIISPVYMLKTRHDGLSVKDLVGIAAVAQTGIASAQLSSIVVEPKRIQKLWSRQKNLMTNNGQPIIPHNSVGGKATISGIKDVEGHYISDNNSEILSGTVDVFNDAFLPQIGYNRRTAPLFHLMVRLGMPNSKAHPIITMFMNQPIIRQYLGLLDRKGANYIIDRASVSQINGSRTFNGPKAITQFPKSLSEITEILKDNIKTFYGNGQELTSDQKAQQKLVFREFLKYAVLADQLFKFQQGSSWDTARMNDPYAAYFKDYQLKEARDKNIFSDINSYMDNSHIGTQKQYVDNVNKTFSDVLVLQDDTVKEAISPILSRIADRFSGVETKKKIARKIEESLLSFLIQTKTGINNSLAYMLVDAKTALVNQLTSIKKTTPDDNVIWKNLILQQLIPSIKGRTILSTKNITLAVKPRDVYSKNLYNKAFQQLYDNPKTTELASSLVKISFLQNGVGNSRISFKDAIPAKLYADVVNTIIGELQNRDALDQFVNTDDFYKNNWNDEDIVPVVYADDYPLGSHIPTFNFIQNLRKEGNIPQGLPGPAIIWIPVNKSEAYSKFLTHIWQEEQADGSTITVKRLLQRVENGPKAAISDTIVDEETGEDDTGILFVQTTALGDADRAQESYSTPHSSVFQNGYSNPKIDVNIPALYDYIVNGDPNEEAEAIDNTPPAPTETSPTPPQITEVTRTSKKEKYTITLANGEKTEREGYKLTVKEYPNFQGMITKHQDGKWSIDELTTSKGVGRSFTTIKEAMSTIPEYLNKVFSNAQNRPLLTQIGLFTFEDFKKGLERKDCG